MGIRFYCPNGHKLNVKEFQGGKRGICPYCGVRIDIPTESTRESSKSSNASAQDTGPQAPSTEAPSATAAQPTSQSMPPSMPSPTSPTGPAMNQPLPEPSAWPAHPTAGPTSPPTAPATHTVPAPQTTTQYSTTGPAPTYSQPQSQQAGLSPPAGPIPPEAPPVASGEPEPPDPLVEAGDVVWYVRPASGGQFGPAGPDVMRTWLEEGRVGADSLVWHEGWRDWKEASEIFAQLSDEAMALVDPIGTGSRASALRNDRALARRRSHTTQTVVIVGLILAVIILFIIFALIVSGAFAHAGDQHDAVPTLTSVLASIWPSLLPVI